MVNKTKSIKETHALAKKFLTLLLATKPMLPTTRAKALVVGLCGDLGTGKTAFTQGLARVLGIKDRVLSPTFILMRKYETDGGFASVSFKQLVHVDAYRFQKAEEINVLEWKKLISEPENVIVVEWADRVEKLLPPGTIKIKFKFIDEHTRAISFPKNFNSA